MNDLDLCLEVVSRSCQLLCDIRRRIFRKPLEVEAWFQRTTMRNWHMDYQMVTWLMKSRDPRRYCEAVRSAVLATAWLLVFVSCRESSIRVPHIPRPPWWKQCQLGHEGSVLTLLSYFAAFKFCDFTCKFIMAHWFFEISKQKKVSAVITVY